MFIFQLSFFVILSRFCALIKRNAVRQTAQQRCEIKLLTKTGIKVDSVVKSRKTFANNMHKLNLPLKSSSSLHNFRISTSFFSVSGAQYFLLAPLNMSSPVGCRFKRKLRSNGLKLSLFVLSFNCWRVCEKMQILENISMLILHVVKHAWSLMRYCKYYLASCGESNIPRWWKMREVKIIETTIACKNEVNSRD